MKASLTNYRQAPRKVRLVAQSLKGKRVSDALEVLAFMPQKAALPLKKLVASALANARQNNASATPENLVIDTVTVDKGMTFFRYMPRAFGRAAPIRKESSHVSITLKEKSDGKAAEGKPQRKAAGAKKPAAAKSKEK